MADKTPPSDTQASDANTPNTADLSRGDTPLQGSGQRLDQAPFPLGIYIVNGVKVNCNGEPIDDEGTVLKGK